MLSPEPMRHLALVVLEGDLEATLRAIAAVGVLHFLDVRGLVDRLGGVQPYDSGENLARLERAAHRLDRIAEFLGLRAAEDEEAPEDTEMTLHDIETRVTAIDAAIDALRNRRTEATERDTRLQHLLRTLHALGPLEIPLEDISRLRYVHLTTGLLPARNLPRLRDSLARIVAVILPAAESTANGRVLVTALCLRQDRDVLDRALRSAQFEALPVPGDLTGTPAEATAQTLAQIRGSRESLAALEEERLATAAQLAPEVRALRARVARAFLLTHARGLMGHSERTSLISGWVPAVLQGRLDQVVRHASGGRCVLQWSQPGELEEVRRGRIHVPILLRNPILVRPFERLLRAYGLPRYGEVDPTPVVALGFLTMFGFMFGDVGQGAVLFVIGFFIYRRLFRYRDYAVILMECGVFAALFGCLYGTVFGVEDWMPALWLRPIDDVSTLMKTALAFGAVFLSLGLGLNVVNAVRRGDPGALWERNGLLAALAYWIAVGLFFRYLTAGPAAVTIGSAALWLALPLGLILLKEPARAVARGMRGGGWPSPSETCVAAVQSLVELLDTIVGMVSNTATFIRLAAFALSHAGLFLATFSVADAIAKSGGGSLGAVLVIVVGNVVIIALEGLIVSIQSVRLEYYEFFSKFYSGGGEPYRPLQLPSARRREGRMHAQ